MANSERYCYFVLIKPQDFDIARYMLTLVKFQPELVLTTATSPRDLDRARRIAMSSIIMDASVWGVRP